ncbi:MAG: hypothetical protein WCE98_11555, partial [Chlorobium sp.]
MVAPNVITKSSGHTVQGGTSQTVNLPSGIVAGDLLVIFIHTISATLTRPDGWTSLASFSNDGTAYVWGRIADGSEGASLSVGVSPTGRSTAYGVYRYDGSVMGFDLSDCFAYSAVTRSREGYTAALTLADSAERSWGVCGWKGVSSDTITSVPWTNDQVMTGNMGAVAYTAFMNLGTLDAEASSEDPGDFTTQYGAAHVVTFTWAVTGSGATFTPASFGAEAGFQPGLALSVPSDVTVYPM